MTFDPNRHMIQLRQKGGGMTDYLPVAARIAWFRDEHPDGAICVEAHAINEQVAIFHARVSVPGGGSAEGWGSETPQDFKDYIEKGSTKAVGRALLALGYGALQAGEELDEGDRIVDSPVDRLSKQRPGREEMQKVQRYDEQDAAPQQPPTNHPANQSAPQRRTPPPPSDLRPAAAPTVAAGTPYKSPYSPGKPPENKYPDLRWEGFKHWAQPLGYDTRAKCETVIKQDTTAWLPGELRTAMEMKGVTDVEQAG